MKLLLLAAFALQWGLFFMLKPHVYSAVPIATIVHKS